MSWSKTDIENYLKGPDLTEAEIPISAGAVANAEDAWVGDGTLNRIGEYIDTNYGDTGRTLTAEEANTEFNLTGNFAIDPAKMEYISEAKARNIRDHMHRQISNDAIVQDVKDTHDILGYLATWGSYMGTTIAEPVNLAAGLLTGGAFQGGGIVTKGVSKLANISAMPGLGMYARVSAGEGFKSVLARQAAENLFVAGVIDAPTEVLTAMNRNEPLTARDIGLQVLMSTGASMALGVPMEYAGIRLRNSREVARRGTSDTELKIKENTAHMIASEHGVEPSNFIEQQWEYSVFTARPGQQEYNFREIQPGESVSQRAWYGSFDDATGEYHHMSSSGKGGFSVMENPNIPENAVHTLDNSRRGTVASFEFGPNAKIMDTEMYIQEAPEIMLRMLDKIDGMKGLTPGSKVYYRNNLAEMIEESTDLHDLKDIMNAELRDNPEGFFEDMLNEILHEMDIDGYHFEYAASSLEGARSNAVFLIDHGYFDPKRKSMLTSDVNNKKGMPNVPEHELGTPFRFDDDKIHFAKSYPTRDFVPDTEAGQKIAKRYNQYDLDEIDRLNNVTKQKDYDADAQTRLDNVSSDPKLADDYDRFVDLEEAAPEGIEELRELAKDKKNLRGKNKNDILALKRLESPDSVASVFKRMFDICMTR